jgi:hypothetical protein
MRTLSGVRLKLAFACVAALGALAMGAGAASAVGTYKYLCTEPGAPAFCSGAGAYHDTFGVAVDNSGGEKNGDVYIASLGEGEQGNVARFTANGAPDPFTGTNPNIEGNVLKFSGSVGATGVAVDSSGDFYVATREVEPNVVDKFTPAGEPVATFNLPGFTSATAVAVDNSGGPSHGDIYVADETSNSVAKLSSTGTLLTTITGSGAHALVKPYGVAVDTHGHVYIDNQNAKVQRFSETGTFEAVIDNHSTQAVAIDPETEDILVINEGKEGGLQIQPYTATGEELEPFGEGTLHHFSVGIGVGKGSHHFVYTSDLEGNVGAFYGIGEGPAVPTTEAATEKTGTTAVLHGTVPTGGETGATGYRFEYNTGGICTGGSSTATELVTGTAVKTEITGLAPKTAYTFCVVAVNLFGAASGSPLSVETTAAKPTVAEETASEEATTSVKASAMINPNGAATTCKVEYGPEETYGNEVACPAGLGEGLAPVPVSVVIPGLEANKQYHFRFAATNGEGTADGTDVPFKTKPLVEAETGEANPVESETATLHGIVKTGTEPGRYFFEYGTSSGPYSNKTEVKEVSGEGSHEVSIPVTGLAPKTIYHYRLVATPVGEPMLEIAGADKTFETTSAKPAVEEEFTENEGRHSVSLWAEINPKNSETTYFFEYGKTEAYGSTSPGGTIPAGILGGVEVGPEAIAELEPGTTYHYRVVATNAAGTTLGKDETFTTTAPQLPIVESEASSLVAQTTATITALVNPDGLQTSYILEVGTEVAPGDIAYTPTYGEVGTEQRELTFPLTGLLPGTTYHYRIVLINEDGTNPVQPGGQTFTTPGFPSVILQPAPVQIVPTPKEEKGPTTTPPLTRAQRYAAAVKLCEKDKSKKKRASCLKTAKKKYGPVTKKKKAKKKK